MLKKIDYFLDRITMYRLVLYFLIALLFIATIYSFVGILAFSSIALVSATIFLVVVSWITNKIFSSIFQAPTNVESLYITALILALIISPVQSAHGYIFLAWAAILAMA